MNNNSSLYYMLFSATTGTIILKSDTQNRTYKVNLFNANQLGERPFGKRKLFLSFLLS